MTSKKSSRKTLSLKKAATPVQQGTSELESAPASVQSEPQPLSEPAVAAPAIAKATAAPKAKPIKAPGKSVAIYAVALAHPQLTGKQFADLVIAQGVKSSAETIGTLRSDFVRAVNFLAQQGLMKSPFIKE